MPWFKIVDPKGAHGHRFGTVVEFPSHAGNALRVAGRIVPAAKPTPPTADADLAKAKASNPKPKPKPVEAAPAPEAPDGLDDRTVKQLKAELKALGLSTKGAKPDLLSRLRGH